MLDNYVTKVNVHSYSLKKSPGTSNCIFFYTKWIYVLYTIATTGRVKAAFIGFVSFTNRYKHFITSIILLCPVCFYSS